MRETNDGRLGPLRLPSRLIDAVRASAREADQSEAEWRREAILKALAERDQLNRLVVGPLLADLAEYLAALHGADALLEIERPTAAWPLDELHLYARRPGSEQRAPIPPDLCTAIGAATVIGKHPATMVLIRHPDGPLVVAGYVPLGTGPFTLSVAIAALPALPNDTDAHL